MTGRRLPTCSEDADAVVKTVIKERERKFVERFMASGNATKAAQQAGYSKRTSSQIGYHLLRKVQIQQAIAERAQRDQRHVEQPEGEQGADQHDDLPLVEADAEDLGHLLVAGHALQYREAVHLSSPPPMVSPRR